MSDDNVDRTFRRLRAMREQRKTRVPKGSAQDALYRQIEERVSKALQEPKTVFDSDTDMIVPDTESEIGKARLRREQIKRSITIVSGT